MKLTLIALLLAGVAGCGPTDPFVESIRKAAEQGDAGAQYNLSVCYRKGEGVLRDMGQAVGWLRKAAEQGHAQAQEVLLGLRLPEDMTEEGQRGGGSGASGGGL